MVLNPKTACFNLLHQNQGTNVVNCVRRTAEIAVIRH
mgnify:CR=1 FL=1